MNKPERIHVYDYPAIKHKLPYMANELIMVIGKKATFKLIHFYGGKTITITQNKRADGKKQFDKLANVVGHNAAERLSIAYSSRRKITVPKCHDAMLYLRNIRIAQRFDYLTSTQGKGKTATDAVAMLVDEYDIATSQVYRALKQGTTPC